MASEAPQLNRKADEVDGKDSNIRAAVVRYDADTYQTIAMLQIAPNPLNPQDGKAVCVAVGGLSKRQGLAKDLFPALLKENQGDIDTAVYEAYEAADAIIEGEKKYPKGFAKELKQDVDEALSDLPDGQ